MICAGDGGQSNIGGCHGDSGGPFVCEIDNRWELHGAVSWGHGSCESERMYTVFARVNFFVIGSFKRCERSKELMISQKNDIPLFKRANYYFCNKHIITHYFGLQQVL